MKQLSRAAFVSFISGDAYMPAALCLKQQLVRLRSRWPLLLVHDDRPGWALSASSTARLRVAYGQEVLVPLTRLMGRLNWTDRAVYGVPNEPRFRSERRARDRWPRRRLLPSLEQMQGKSGAAAACKQCAWLTPWLKLWVWGLNETYEQLLLLDLDVLLLRNIDGLLSTWPLDEKLVDARKTRRATQAAALGQSAPSSAAIGAVRIQLGECQGPFNSGFVIFRPSLASLAGLQSYARAVLDSTLPWPPKACEVRVSDQSLLNFFFRYTWHSLPSELNWSPAHSGGRRAIQDHAAHFGRASAADGITTRIGAPLSWAEARNRSGRKPVVLHFTAEPKPWQLSDANDVLMRQRVGAPALRAWRDACGDLVLGYKVQG